MREAGRWLWDVRTPMRDGTVLSTDVHLPPAGLPGGPYPAVLIRTEAGNQAAALVASARRLADDGFAVALQDVRGCEDSEGAFRPFLDEGTDGFDAVEWTAAQSWCSGTVALMGEAYAGWAAFAAASLRPPHLTTVISTDPWLPGPWRNGTLDLQRLAWLHATSARVWQEAIQVDWQTVLRHLPLRTVEHAMGCRLPVWHDWLDSPAAAVDHVAVDVPVLRLSHDSLYDDTRDHVLVLGVEGEEAETLQREWLEHHLLQKGPRPPSRYLLTGSGTWRDEHWSAADSWRTWFLRWNGELSEDAPGDEMPAAFRYDPMDPVLLTADFTFFPSPARRPSALPTDRRFVERRSDVLTFTTPELTVTEVVGRPVVQLQTSSDCPDTDWFVHLADVAPGGASTVLARGCLRARFREGLGAEVLMSPGQVYAAELVLEPVAHTVLAGHRLRLAVTSSAFPLSDRNLNTGGRIGDETEPRVATNTVHHDAAHLSRLLLPVKGS